MMTCESAWQLATHDTSKKERGKPTSYKVISSQARVILRLMMTLRSVFYKGLYPVITETEWVVLWLNFNINPWCTYLSKRIKYYDKCNSNKNSLFCN